MKFELKDYKFYKIQKIIKNSSCIFFFQSANLNFLNWVLKIEQKLKPKNLNYYKVHNTFLKKKLKNSIFLNLFSIINSNIILVKPYLKYSFFDFKKILSLSSVLQFLGLKLNNKFYVVTFLKNFFYLSYHKNLIMFYIVLKTSLKFLSLKLKKI